jgi:hypothetical protein
VSVDRSGSPIDCYYDTMNNWIQFFLYEPGLPLTDWRIEGRADGLIYRSCPQVMSGRVWVSQFPDLLCTDSSRCVVGPLFTHFSSYVL